MANLQKPTRFYKEDFDTKYAKLIESIANIFNSFGDEVYDAFQKKINFDNLNQDIQKVTVTTVSGTPTLDTQFKTTVDGNIQGIVCINAENLTNPGTYPTNTPFISFTSGNHIIKITNVVGLQDNNKYRLTLMNIGN